MVSISNRQCDLVTLEKDNYTCKEVLGRRRKRRGIKLIENPAPKSNDRRQTDINARVQNHLNSMLLWKITFLS